MPGAWIAHAAQLFNGESPIDIGIHLTLTSEWTSVKWRPLTSAPTLVDQNGDFFPLLTPRTGDGRPNLLERKWSIDDIAKEFKAQIELGLAAFPKATHISSHMIRHFSDFDQRVGDVVSDLCNEFSLKDDLFGHGLPRFSGYPKTPRETAHRVASFIEQLKDLEPGTYIFVDHPAAESSELRATGHPGYDDVFEDRTTCLETLINGEVKSHIVRAGIDLISYGDL